MRPPAAPETALQARRAVQLGAKLEAGLEPELEAELDAVLQSGVDDGTTPGAAAAIVTRDGWSLRRCVGTLHREAGAARVDEDTAWDLASLTKLLCTTLITAHAVDQGRLQVSEAPWPGWPGVTVEQVLRHEAGLPAWAPLYETARRLGAVGLPPARAAILEAVHATALERPPGAVTVYSDIGMIALGCLLEERLGAPLDRLFADIARTSFGDTDLRFVRLGQDGYHPAMPHVAPTERCPWRRRTLHGQVHDDNCFALGGVAGHAGLFGSLRDVESAAKALLTPSATMAHFAAVPGEVGRRPVGWDRATPGGSTGDALGPHTVGHLGFTGCSLWVDPDAGAAYVLLTNRIHPSKEGPERILALRRAFHRVASTWTRQAA